MSFSKPAGTPGRRARSTIRAALVVVSTALVGALAYQALAQSSPSVASPRLVPSSAPLAPPRPGPEPLGTLPSTQSPPTTAPPTRPPGDQLDGGHGGAVGEADGVVPDGATVFDDEVPAVTNLDPALLG